MFKKRYIGRKLDFFPYCWVTSRKHESRAAPVSFYATCFCNLNWISVPCPPKGHFPPAFTWMLKSLPAGSRKGQEAYTTWKEVVQPVGTIFGAMLHYCHAPQDCDCDWEVRVCQPNSASLNHGLSTVSPPNFQTHLTCMPASKSASTSNAWRTLHGGAQIWQCHLLWKPRHITWKKVMGGGSSIPQVRL